MLKFKFDHNSQKILHTCRTQRDGDTIIYSCPKCDYRMVENFETGDIHIENDDPRIQHHGSYIPHNLLQVLENQN